MAKIIGKDLPNMPWQEAPTDSKQPVWRYDKNPIIDRFATKNSNSIFNSAVVPFQDGYAGVFRCDSKSISMDIFVGFSKDGLHWDISQLPFRVRTQRWQSVIFVMIQEFVFWRIGIILHGVTDTMSILQSG